MIRALTGMNLKLDTLKGHVPDKVIEQIPDVVQTMGVSTPLRMAHFLAQCAHESGGFRLTQENLNYSVNGLLSVFKKYFPSLVLANAYARQPVKIANRVYGNRMGNGQESTGDGYKYRGRGYIQLTGKNNYVAFDATVPDNIIQNPDLVATKYPLLSAAWFWRINNLNVLADKGATDAHVTAITRRVNGGVNGLADRLQYFKKFYALLK